MSEHYPVPSGAAHPITPPPELVQQWAEELFGPITAATDAQQYIATQAARWGADRELEACCDFLELEQRTDYAALLRAARRPKPPTLKKQALAQLDSLHADLKMHGLGTNTDIICHALEQLDD